MIFALTMGIVSANEQENKSVKESNGSDGQPTLTKEVYPQKEAEGDLYHGLTKKLTFDRMIPPHGLEVTYDKTVHIIFPAEVRYVDLGSPNLIAGRPRPYHDSGGSFPAASACCWSPRRR